MRRDFWCLFQGQLVSHLGTQAFQVMSLYYLAQQTGTPGAGAAYLALGLIPPVLLGPWLTAWSSRFSPRAVLVACDALSAALTLPMIAALGFGAPRPVVVAALLATVTLMATVNALMLPSIHAAVPRLVAPERLAHANSFIVTTQQLASVIGQGAGGLLYGFAGPIALCSVTCAGFLGSAAWGSRLRDPAVVDAPRAAPVRIPPFSLLRTHRAFRRLALTSALFNALYAPWLVLLPFHLAPTGPLAPQTFGMVLAAYGLGNIAGAFALRRLGARAGPSLLSRALVFQSLGLFALGAAHEPWLVAGVLALLGAGIGVANVQTLTRVQTLVPLDCVSQATAVLRSSVQVATPAGFVLVAITKTSLDFAPGTIYQVCGAALLVLLLPHLRALTADGVPAPAGGAAAGATPSTGGAGERL